MKIEEGKFYRTRYGEKVGPMFPSGHKYMPWQSRNRPFWYSENGKVREGKDSDQDIIAEWTDNPKTWGEMTDAEKGALLLAAHEGKAIEWTAGDLSEGGVCSPSAVGKFRSYCYRIRPEPKRCFVTLYGCGHEWGQASEPCHHDTHRIDFDTIDGQPDCDSIRMEPIK